MVSREVPRCLLGIWALARLPGAPPTHGALAILRTIAAVRTSGASPVLWPGHPRRQGTEPARPKPALPACGSRDRRASANRQIVAWVRRGLC